MTQRRNSKSHGKKEVKAALSKNGRPSDSGDTPSDSARSGPAQSWFSLVVVLALVGLWSSMAVIYFDVVDYESVLARAKELRLNFTDVLQGKLSAYDSDGDGDFDLEDAKVLLDAVPPGGNASLTDRSLRSVRLRSALRQELRDVHRSIETKRVVDIVLSAFREALEDEERERRDEERKQEERAEDYQKGAGGIERGKAEQEMEQIWKESKVNQTSEDQQKEKGPERQKEELEQMERTQVKSTQMEKKEREIKAEVQGGKALLQNDQMKRGETEKAHKMEDRLQKVQSLKARQGDKEKIIDEKVKGKLDRKERHGLMKLEKERIAKQQRTEGRSVRKEEVNVVKVKRRGEKIAKVVEDRKGKQQTVEKLKREDEIVQEVVPKGERVKLEKEGIKEEYKQAGEEKEERTEREVKKGEQVKERDEKTQKEQEKVAKMEEEAKNKTGMKREEFEKPIHTKDKIAEQPGEEEQKLPETIVRLKQIHITELEQTQEKTSKVNEDKPQTEQERAGRVERDVTAKAEERKAEYEKEKMGKQEKTEKEIVAKKQLDILEKEKLEREAETGQRLTKLKESLERTMGDKEIEKFPQKLPEKERTVQEEKGAKIFKPKVEPEQLVGVRVKEMEKTRSEIGIERKLAENRPSNIEKEKAEQERLTKLETMAKDEAKFKQEQPKRVEEEDKGQGTGQSESKRKGLAEEPPVAKLERKTTEGREVRTMIGKESDDKMGKEMMEKERMGAEGESLNSEQENVTKPKEGTMRIPQKFVPKCDQRLDAEHVEQKQTKMVKEEAKEELKLQKEKAQDVNVEKQDADEKIQKITQETKAIKMEEQKSQATSVQTKTQKELSKKTDPDVQTKLGQEWAILGRSENVERTTKTELKRQDTVELQTKEQTQAAVGETTDLQKRNLTQMDLKKEEDETKLKTAEKQMSVTISQKEKVVTNVGLTKLQSQNVQQKVDILGEAKEEGVRKVESQTAVKQTTVEILQKQKVVANRPVVKSMDERVKFQTKNDETKMDDSGQANAAVAKQTGVTQTTGQEQVLTKHIATQTNLQKEQIQEKKETSLQQTTVSISQKEKVDANKPVIKTLIRPESGEKIQTVTNLKKPTILGQTDKVNTRETEVRKMLEQEPVWMKEQIQEKEKTNLQLTTAAISQKESVVTNKPVIKNTEQVVKSPTPSAQQKAAILGQAKEVGANRPVVQNLKQVVKLQTVHDQLKPVVAKEAVTVNIQQKASILEDTEPTVVRKTAEQERVLIKQNATQINLKNEQTEKRVVTIKPVVKNMEQGATIQTVSDQTKVDVSGKAKSVVAKEVVVRKAVGLERDLQTQNLTQTDPKKDEDKTKLPTAVKQMTVTILQKENVVTAKPIVKNMEQDVKLQTATVQHKASILGQVEKEVVGHPVTRQNLKNEEERMNVKQKTVEIPPKVRAVIKNTERVVKLQTPKEEGAKTPTVVRKTTGQEQVLKEQNDKRLKLKMEEDQTKLQTAEKKMSVEMKAAIYGQAEKVVAKEVVVTKTTGQERDLKESNAERQNLMTSAILQKEKVVANRTVVKNTQQANVNVHQQGAVLRPAKEAVVRKTREQDNSVLIKQNGAQTNMKREQIQEKEKTNLQQTQADIMKHTEKVVANKPVVKTPIRRESGVKVPPINDQQRAAVVGQVEKMVAKEAVVRKTVEQERVLTKPIQEKEKINLQQTKTDILKETEKVVSKIPAVGQARVLKSDQMKEQQKTNILVAKEEVARSMSGQERVSKLSETETKNDVTEQIKVVAKEQLVRKVTEQAQVLKLNQTKAPVMKQDQQKVKVLVAKEEVGRKTTSETKTKNDVSEQMKAAQPEKIVTKDAAVRKVIGQERGSKEHEATRLNLKSEEDKTKMQKIAAISQKTVAKIPAVEKTVGQAQVVKPDQTKVTSLGQRVLATNERSKNEHTQEKVTKLQQSIVTKGTVVGQGQNAAKPAAKTELKRRDQDGKSPALVQAGRVVAEGQDRATLLRQNELKVVKGEQLNKGKLAAKVTEKRPTEGKKKAMVLGQVEKRVPINQHLGQQLKENTKGKEELVVRKVGEGHLKVGERENKSERAVRVQTVALEKRVEAKEQTKAGTLERRVEAKEQTKAGTLEKRVEAKEQTKAGTLEKRVEAKEQTKAGTLEKRVEAKEQTKAGTLEKRVEAKEQTKAGTLEKRVEAKEQTKAGTLEKRVEAKEQIKAVVLEKRVEAKEQTKAGALEKCVEAKEQTKDGAVEKRVEPKEQTKAGAVGKRMEAKEQTKAGTLEKRVVAKEQMKAGAFEKCMEAKEQTKAVALEKRMEAKEQTKAVALEKRVEAKEQTKAVALEKRVEAKEQTKAGTFGQTLGQEKHKATKTQAPKDNAEKLQMQQITKHLKN